MRENRAGRSREGSFPPIHHWELISQKSEKPGTREAEIQPGLQVTEKGQEEQGCAVVLMDREMECFVESGVGSQHVKVGKHPGLEAVMDGKG